jgi:NAD-reducing hydrogenase small subunit
VITGADDSTADRPPEPHARARIATAWLGGCSGCHMSFLDMDEFLFELNQLAQVVYSPLVDAKDVPDDIDVFLLEGAIANEDNLEVAQEARAKSKVVVSLGDCAVTGNVTAMRNPLGDPVDIVTKVYVDAADANPQIPDEEGVVPRLMPKVLPVHQVIDVDVYVPGCPPDAERIRRAVLSLLGNGEFGTGADDIRFG